MFHSGVAQVRVVFEAFVRWWLSELYDIACELLGRVFPRWFSDARMYLSTTGGELIVRHDARERSWPLQRGPDGTWIVANHDPAMRSIVQGASATVTLPGQSVLSYELSLPAQAERELRGLVALNVERSVPLASRELAIDYAIAHRDPSARRIVVSVWVARSGEIAKALASVATIGMRPTRLGLLIGDRIVASFPTDEALRVEARGWWNRGLIASAVLLSVIAVGFELGEHLYERTLASRELDRLEPQASAARKLRSELDRRQKIFVQLVDTLRQPDAVEALSVLTVALPEEGWAQNVEIQASLGKPPELRMSVETAAKDNVLKALQQASRLDASMLVSSVIEEAGRERLELTTHLRGENGTNRGERP